MQNQTLHERIKEARSRLGWSQAKLAEQLGVTRNAVSLWETGHSAPSVARLASLSKMANVSLDWLLLGIEQFDQADRLKIDFRPAPILTVEEIAARDTPTKGEDFVLIDKDAGENSYAIRVFDAAMEPRFLQGDMLVIDPDAPIAPGDFVLAVLQTDKGRAPVTGRFQEGPLGSDKEPTIRLARINNDFRTIEIGADQPGQVLGRIVRHMSYL